MFEAKEYQKFDEILAGVCSKIEGFDVNFIYDNDFTIQKRITELENGKAYPSIVMTGWSDVSESSLNVSVTIDQLWILTLTEAEVFSEERSKKNYETVLLPIQNEFEYRLKNSKYFVFHDLCNGLDFNLRRREMDVKTTKSINNLPSNVDAIVYEGLKLTLKKIGL